MRMLGLETLLLVGGVGLAGVFAFPLHESGRLRHSQNPLALQRSGYGMILARLSQDTVNKIWHFGIEGPGSKQYEERANCGHSQVMDCEVSGKNGGPVSYHAAQKEILPPAQLLSVAGLRPEGTNGEGSKILQNTVQSISDLKKSKYCRTNPWGMTQAHHAKVAEDIERILLRSYRMDPTDYGVYNAYHLFLVIHNLRANPASELQAKKVAGISVAAAMNEEESPFPWLTAASALLDQFLLDQQKSREMGQDLPWSVIDDYGKRIAYCLERFRAIQEVALTEHRWERIGAERTASALDRLQFLERAAEQFGAMLARMESRRSCVRR